MPGGSRLLGVLIFAVLVEGAKGNIGGGAGEHWWACRKENEMEAVMLVSIAMEGAKVALEEWQDRQLVPGRVDKSLYSRLSKVVQFASGVQEILFNLVEGKGR